MNAARASVAASVAAMLVTLVPAQQVTVPAPQRFQWVLWCSDVAHGASSAARLGFTAVQLGRGVDPAPLVEAGLGYYLDQPIGKGVLELRDEQWQPLARAYERDRDPAGLLRPGCFATPGLLDEAAAAAVAEVMRVRGPALQFVALADEASATRHDAPLDTCRCEHCLAAFRVFLLQRHPDLNAANGAMGTHYASFADAMPVSTDQIRRRELGERALPRDLRAFGLAREFADRQFAAAIARLAGAIQQAVPEVPVGLTGLPAPAAFGGNDFGRLLPALTLIEPYAIGGAVELGRSLAAPGAHRYTTLIPPTVEAQGGVALADWVRANVAAMACSGLAGVVVWNDGTVAGADGVATPFGAAVQAAMQQQAGVLAACAGATVEPASIWLVESQPSVRTHWMLDSVGDGMTWVRRLASYEQTHSTSQAARLGWLRLLQDLGLQPRFVVAEQLPERLLQEQPRCLVLPATIALADRAVQAIEVYVRNGGVLLADHGTALYDEQLLRRERGALDLLFGITERSLDWEDQLVREGRSVASSRGVPLAERQLRGALSERRGDGDAQIENKLGKGLAVYLNAPVVAYPGWRLDEGAVERARDLRRRVRAVLQRARVDPPCEVRGDGLPTCIERTVLRLRDGRRVVAIRLQALERPAVWQQLAANGPRRVFFELPVPRRLRRLDGEELGTTARVELQLDPFGALFVEVVD